MQTRLPQEWVLLTLENILSNQNKTPVTASLTSIIYSSKLAHDVQFTVHNCIRSILNWRAEALTNRCKDNNQLWHSPRVMLKIYRIIPLCLLFIDFCSSILLLSSQGFKNYIQQFLIRIFNVFLYSKLFRTVLNIFFLYYKSFISISHNKYVKKNS